MEKHYELLCGGIFAEFRIIKDLRVLKKIEKKYNMEFDKSFKYCTKIGNFINDYTSVGGYRLKYFDGCFYPYLVQNVSFE